MKTTPPRKAGRGGVVVSPSLAATLARMAYRKALPVEAFDERVMRYVDTSGGPDSCHPWRGARTRGGYGHISVRHDCDGAYKSRRVPRLIVSWAYGLPLDGKWRALHMCDNPACCNPNHITPGTSRENSRQMVERNRNSKSAYRLTTEQVEEIRTARAAGVPRAKVAEKYQIHPEHVTAICSRRYWK